MKKTTTHCDHCGKQVDYIDSDCDYNEEGFFLATDDAKQPSTVQFRNSFRTNCGTSSHPIELLVMPNNICDKDCMIKYFNKWLMKLPESRD